MKPVLFSKFRFNKRAVAKEMWGDVSHYYPTGQKRASYFVCSGHGGYVCDPKDYTERERVLLGTPQEFPLRVLVGVKGGEKYVLGASYSPRARTFSVSPLYKDIHWEPYSIYTFEEDDAWAVLEHVTGVRARVNPNLSEARKNECIRDLIHEFYPELVIMWE